MLEMVIASAGGIMGVTHAYRCDHCPLIIELGGHRSLDTGTEWVQVICQSCGTMHRLIEERGVCEVIALAGPVRSLRTVTVRMPSGEQIPWRECYGETEWESVGKHRDRLRTVSRTACSRCGEVGRMLTLAKLLEKAHAVGNATDPEPAVDCPMCRYPLELFAITDMI